jgi:hypothetical protein
MLDTGINQVDKNEEIQCHSSFRWLRSQFIQSLNLEVQAFEHRVTGVKHYHLASSSQENVFLVALKTIPTDSTGVAHILEHTVLCGSEKYPVRDPFFMMLRRSLNTFMNAFTSADWTAYPFASQNKKDFYNLLDVYLDAVFFARLDPLDFAQEGHRLEFADPNNADSDLQYKGVVFNEMKGAMSSTISSLWQTLTKYLYPTTTYHFNSGGEPSDIPDLSYEELVAFYHTHYHPSNAVLMTYGNEPVADLQERFHSKALKRFERLDVRIEVADEKKYNAPVNVQEFYAADEGGDNKTHHVLGWLLGQSTDLHKQLEAHLLSNVLLNDSSSPLRQALETTDLGSTPSPLCGLEDSNREMCFVCGLEGSEAGQAEAFEQLVMRVLKDVAEKGVPHKQVESVLHQLELGQREVRGDSFPYGLQLILSGLPAAIHGADPMAVMNLDPVLDTLRESIKDPEYIKNLVRDLLLENNHRVRLSFLPEAELNQRKEALEAKRLAEIKSRMVEQDKENIVAVSKALDARQKQDDDVNILPKVSVEDIPEGMSIPVGIKQSTELPITYYQQGTNGLVYQEIIYEMPALDDELLAAFPYYALCMTELGCGDRSYLEMQAWQSSVSGGVYASHQIRGLVDDEQKVKSYFTLAAKGLSRNHAGVCELVHETLTNLRFDEHQRIKDIISQKRSAAEQSVTGSGHSLALKAACSGMSPVAAMQHRLGGLAGIVAVKALDESLKHGNAIALLADKFQRIHSAILSSPKQFLLIGETENCTSYAQALQQTWSNDISAVSSSLPFQLAPIRKQVKQLWIVNTQVSFCAKAYPTVPVMHPDAPALTVLGEFIKNGYLHRVIREQGGAYGSGANQDSSISAFRFYSYRDPRLQDTLEDFDRALDWLASTQHKEQQLEEAILGIISSIDKPGSPAGEAKSAFHNELFGRTAEQREAFRSRVLAVSIDDLLNVTETYLSPEKASVAVVTYSEKAAEIADAGSYERFVL